MNTVTTVSSLNNLIKESNVLQQLSVPRLVEKIIERNEGVLSHTGAVCVKTGKYTGRSPKDKFIADETSVHEKIDWGTVNQPITTDNFQKLYEKMLAYLRSKNELFLFRGFAGAEREFQLPILVITEYAWHSLFARQLFIRPDLDELKGHKPEFTILFAPGVKADPETEGTNSETFIAISFEQRVILIGGTEYAGEMKKSVFSIMNFLLPEKDILPMHCSANMGNDGNVALFFGLSGTGKTTLSADPKRRLIGDDEHGWSNKGIFNIEGGCYAKCINLSKEKEPQIYSAIRFGAVLENVIINQETGLPDYNDTRITENTRAAYPIHAIKNVVEPSIAGHPKTIIFLTADAFGVLPPIAKLTKEQALYHFLSGYTSKMAGTERGITVPETTFSACYGAPFLPLPATKYAEMLGKKIEDHHVHVFLVNTGWTGGGFGTGERIRLEYTRTMVEAAISGGINNSETKQEDYFGLQIPVHVPGIPENLLFPMNTWPDRHLYDRQAKKLAAAFRENFKKFYDVPESIEKKGGPII